MNRNVLAPRLELTLRPLDAALAFALAGCLGGGRRGRRRSARGEQHNADIYY